MNTADDRRPFQRILSGVSVPFLVLAAALPSAAQTAREAEIIEEFDAMLARLTEQELFSGTALLARGDEVLYEAAYGLASRRWDVPNNIDTRFHMGSMNKMFTGVAVCQLAEQGKLDFDDLIVEHLPDYPNQEVAQKVTIHHLLTHTSGLGSYWNEAYEAAMPRLERVADYLPLFVEDPLAFEPGSQSSYSNCGPVVLGLIIEAVTGQDYFDYVEEHVLKPAGMTRTGHWSFHEPEPNVAMGYTHMDPDGESLENWRNNVFLVGPLSSPAGGAFTNVHDMLRFSRALQSGKLFSKEMFTTMTASKAASTGGRSGGYLHANENRQGVHALGHNGGGPGVSCDFAYFPELGYTLVVLSNVDMGAMQPSSFLREKLFDLAPRVTPSSRAILGTWEMETESGDGAIPGRMTLEDRAGLISGRWESRGVVMQLEQLGFAGGELTFMRTIPTSGRAVRFEGLVDGDAIFGVYRSGQDELPCQGTRLK
jgi:D-alanyl-D-alanine carboxypeptidase